MTQYYEMFGYEQEEISRMDIKREGEFASKKKSFRKYDHIENIVIEKSDASAELFKNYNLDEIVCHILNSIQEITKDHFYGVSIIIDVLRGAHSSKIKEKNFYELECYGTLDFYSREEIITIIEWMLSKGLLLKTKSKYPVIHITAKGFDYKNSVSKKDFKELRKNMPDSNNISD